MIDAIVDKRPIYGFWQEEVGGKYEFVGKLAVNGYSYELVSDRKVYKFNIVKI